MNCGSGTVEESPKLEPILDPKLDPIEPMLDPIEPRLEPIAPIGPRDPIAPPPIGLFIDKKELLQKYQNCVRIRWETVVQR